MISTITKFSKLLFTISFSLWATFATNAQFTSIPDAKFEAKLIALNIDKDATVNGKVATADIAGITTLNVQSSSIVDLTGIQDFVALTSLNININRIVSLDLSKNVALKTLNANFNQFTTLDLSKNTKLVTVNLEGGKLASLDISTCTALKTLVVTTNALTSLNVSASTALTTLKCNENVITSLDVTKNTALTLLNCDNNKLTALDVTKNVNLATLNCYTNKITALDVLNNTALTYLDCNDNAFSGKLNLTKNASLTSLYVQNNTGLSLICLSSLSIVNSSFYKDQGAVWGTDCGTVTNVFSEVSQLETIFPNPSNGNFTLVLPSAAQVLVTDLSGKALFQNNYAEGKNQVELNNLKSGVYLLSVVSTNKKTVQQIVID